MTKNRFFFEKISFYCIRSKNVSNVVHDLKNVKIAQRSLKFWPVLANFSYILMNLNQVLKKVGRERSHKLFSFNFFLNLRALGYAKSETIF
jgi:hypothetical protein